MKNGLCLILLSGGMDSATVLYWARNKGYQCRCLIFDYGQRHRRELNSAKSLAHAAHAPFDLIEIKLPWKSTSSLLSPKINIPSHPIEQIGKKGIPSTYVPGRNTLFLAYALSAADALKARAIALGPNALDFSGYPDCRPAYYQAMAKTARLGTKRGSEGNPIKLLTPIIHMNKSEIVRLGECLGVPWKLTWSCYAGGAQPCRRCDSCQLRAKGFRIAGIADPLLSPIDSL
ncbi:MAG: 7-cyano-7-deazaguanine synthase QueC [Elusimicrobia bacterium]|nr:7-cyano-7-deazaguanine synthase QueC [Elusimicrobiota bacterium]